MRLCRAIIFFLFAAGLFCGGLIVSAAGVGFIPASAIWLSRSIVAPKETVRVYTVLVNNEYASIDGAIGVYANDRLIGEAEIKNLLREHAEQIHVDWKPEAGSYTLSARIARMTATTDEGGKIQLDVSDIGRAAGSPLVVGGDETTASGKTPVKTPAGTSLSVEVKKEGGKLNIVSDTSPAGGGDAVQVKSPRPQGPSLADHAVMFEKNREAIARAASAAKQMVDTVQAASESEHAATSTILDRGKNYYAQAGTIWAESKTYRDRLWQWWLFVSNHNDPKRVVEIALGLIALRYIFRFFWRRRQRE